MHVSRGTWVTFHILIAYSTLTLVPIIGKLGANNWWFTLINMHWRFCMGMFVDVYISLTIIIK